MLFHAEKSISESSYGVCGILEVAIGLNLPLRCKSEAITAAYIFSGSLPVSFPFEMVQYQLDEQN